MKIVHRLRQPSCLALCNRELLPPDERYSHGNQYQCALNDDTHHNNGVQILIQIIAVKLANVFASILCSFFDSSFGQHGLPGKRSANYNLANQNQKKWP
jgi:hypothetical protein